MVSKNLEIGDLVWAKMKGYPPWPGTIMAPPSEKKSKPKKNHQYIYFFGSNNYAWIAEESIELHSETLLEKYGKRKGELFHKAMETIIEYSKDASKYRTFVENVERQEENVSEASESEKSFDKITNGDSQSKKKSLQDSVSEKVKKKTPVKKVPSVEKHPQEKKSIRKRKHSPDQDKPETSSGTFTFEDCYFYDSEHLNLPAIQYLSSKRAPTTFSNPLERKFVERPITPPVELMYKSETLKKKEIKPTEMVIGLLGLTKIGAGIAKNLCHSGHNLVIWNETPSECRRFSDQFEKIEIATTPAEVLASADITFCCVSDPELARKLVLGNYGILKEIEHSREEIENSRKEKKDSNRKKEKGFVQMTSMDPKWSQTIGTEITIKGGRYLEAPICGSRLEANEGSLMILASGDQELYKDCESCLDAISKKHMFVSAEVGTASKLNVVHNMVVGTSYAALAESLSLIDKVGIKGEDFFEILEASHLNSSSLMHKLTAMIETNYVTDISLKQVQQDFRLGLALGSDISQRTALFAIANEKYKLCKAMGYSDHDVSALFEATRP